MDKLVEKVALVIRQNTRPYESLRDGKTITAEEIAGAIIPLIAQEIKGELEREFGERPVLSTDGYNRVVDTEMVIRESWWDKFWGRYV